MPTPYIADDKEQRMEGNSNHWKQQQQSSAKAIATETTILGNSNSYNNRRQRQLLATTTATARTKGSQQQKEANGSSSIATATYGHSNSSNNVGHSKSNSTPPPPTAARAPAARAPSIRHSKSNSTPPPPTAAIHSNPTTIVGNSNSNRSETAKGEKSKRKDEKRRKQRMSSNFLKNAAPSTTIHQTYDQLSQMKTNKTGERDRNWRQDANAILQHVKQIALKTVGFENSWRKEYTSEEAVSIESFTTLYSTNKKFILAFDKSEPSLQIFAKASTQFAKQCLGTPGNIEITRTFAGEIVESKPKIGQGTKCDSVNNGYAIMGMRPNRLTSGNGVYVFKKNVDPTTKDSLEQTALHIVKEMQLCLSPMVKFVNQETTVMNEAFAFKNPEATVILQTDTENWFYRCFVATPIASGKYFGKLTTPVFVGDCFHYKEHNYDGVCFVLVTKTSYGNTIPLVWAIIPAEKTSELSWVIQCCWKHGTPVDLSVRSKHDRLFTNYKPGGNEGVESYNTWVASSQQTITRYILALSNSTSSDSFFQNLISLYSALLDLNNNPLTKHCAGVILYLLKYDPKLWTVFANSEGSDKNIHQANSLDNVTL
eukprot:jgi/Psemu1/9560/gm1.9560_g